MIELLDLDLVIEIKGASESARCIVCLQNMDALALLGQHISSSEAREPASDDYHVEFSIIL